MYVVMKAFYPLFDNELAVGWVSTTTKKCVCKAMQMHVSKSALMRLIGDWSCLPRVRELDKILALLLRLEWWSVSQRLL